MDADDLLAGFVLLLAVCSSVAMTLTDGLVFLAVDEPVRIPFRLWVYQVPLGLGLLWIRPRPRQLSRATQALGIWVAVVWLSAFWAADATLAVNRALLLSQAWLALALVEAAVRRGAVTTRSVVGAVAATIALHAVVGLAQLLWVNGKGITPTAAAIGPVDVGRFTIGAAGGAYVLAALLALLLALLVVTSARHPRPICIVAATILAAGVLRATTTNAGRGAGILAAAVAVAAVPAGRRATPAVVAVVAVAILLLPAAGASATVQADGGQSTSDGTPAVGSFDVDGLDSRLAQYELALGVFADHPVTGVGGFNFQAAAAPELDRPVPVHNVYLSVLANTGLLGAIPFAAGVALAARRLLPRARADVLVGGVAAGLLAVGAFGVFDHLVLTRPTALLPVAVVLGAALGGEHP